MKSHLSQLGVLALTHQTTPLEVRENFAFTEESLPRFYTRLRQYPGVEECAILNTCNRVEIYTVGAIRQNQVLKLFCEFHDAEPAYLGQYCVWEQDAAALRHLFSVAAGLDSQMPGETEILGQVKAAYQYAQEQDHLGSVLNRAFQKSFQNAKWIRTHTGIGKGQVSPGNIAAELAIRIFGDLAKTRILMIGTGEIGQQTLKAFRSRGASAVLTVTSRTLGKARLLAAEHGGVALDFELVADTMRYFDIILCATASPHAIMTHKMVFNAMQTRRDEPLFLIDQAVPRDIEDSVRKLTNVYLYNLDDLAEIANENLKSRQAELKKCLEITHEKSDRTWQAIVAQASDKITEASSDRLMPGK